MDMSKCRTAYCYSPTFHSHELRTIQNNTNSKPDSLNKVELNKSSPYSNKDKNSCFCFRKNDDNVNRVRLKTTKRKVPHSCVCSIIICTILLAYTFVGAIIFLAIERSSGFYSFASSNTTKSVSVSSVKSSNYSVSADINSVAGTRLSLIGEEVRAKTVENIWDITVGLNILYRENWTRLAAREIKNFQEQIFQRLVEEMSTKSQATLIMELQADRTRCVEDKHKVEWNLAKAVLYSLTVLTTTGYTNSAPRTTLGKAVTMVYAAMGIPLMLIYLTSVGNLLSDRARGVFTRSLCCCLCSNCGYCCYDERRMQEKERRMRKKREQKEYQQHIQALLHRQEPFYVRSNSSTSTSNNQNSPARRDCECVKLATTRSPSINLDTDTLIDDKPYPHGNCLAPVSLCFIIMIIYICGGALVLCRLESSWTYFDSIFFCFMALSTIGLGESITSSSVISTKINQSHIDGNLIYWFCSLYLVIGMAITAMCFNVVHDEIVIILKHRHNESPRLLKETSVSSKPGCASNNLDSENSVVNNTLEYPVAS